jgi:hypothetical protein
MGATFGLSTNETAVEPVRQPAPSTEVRDPEPFGPKLTVVSTKIAKPARTKSEPPADPGCARGRKVSSKPAYGWPVKPFHRQHPVRGYFGDPRIGPDPDGTIHRTLHFGVDVSAPDGTAVYATASGVAAANSLHRDVVRILTGDGVELSYWHISPTVRPGQRVVAYETLIGHIEDGWGHVHVSEQRGGVFVNPLRAGAMGPYEDGTCPAVKQVRFERDGRRLRASSVRGRVDVVVGAFDRPALSAPAPWRDLPVTPALVEWRLVGAGGRVVRSWHIAYDVRSSLPSGSYDSVYAIRTKQNRPNRPGTYRFHLARDWDSGELRNGHYAVEVRVVDTRGNRHRSSWPFTVAN